MLLVLALLGLLGACSSSGGTTTSGTPAPSVGATASVSTSTPVEPADPGLVVVVGDSITEQGEDVLTEVLGGTWPLAIDGRSGFRVAEQQPAAEDLAERTPTQVVINLGTNDVLQGADLDQAAADLRTMVATFPGATCIHLVTINESIVSGGRSRAEASGRVNAAIAEIAAGEPRIDVVDWSAAVAEDEAGPEPEGRIVPDTIHPSPRGQHVLAGLYADVLAACPVAAQQ